MGLALAIRLPRPIFCTLRGGFGEAQISLTISLALGRDRQLDTSAGP